MKTMISLLAAVVVALTVSACGGKVDCAKLDKAKCEEAGSKAATACVWTDGAEGAAGKCAARADADICDAANKAEADKIEKACKDNSGLLGAGSCVYNKDTKTCAHQAPATK